MARVASGTAKAKTDGLSTSAGVPAKSPLLSDGFDSIIDSMVVDLTMGVSMRVDMLDSITDSIVVELTMGVLVVDIVDMEGMDIGRRGSEHPSFFGIVGEVAGCSFWGQLGSFSIVIT